MVGRIGSEPLGFLQDTQNVFRRENGSVFAAVPVVDSEEAMSRQFGNVAHYGVLVLHTR